MTMGLHIIYTLQIPNYLEVSHEWYHLQKDSDSTRISLETNILNLAVVLPLVFSLGKDTLTSILDTRREKILSSLRSADDRFKQAQLELDAAKSELALAADKVKEIQSEGQKTMEALRLEETKRYEELHQRFDDLKAETVRLEEEKVVNDFPSTTYQCSF